MRILFITPSYKPAYIYGGTVVVIPLLAESLVLLGHEVTVYTTTADGSSELPVTPNKSVMVDGVTVYYFNRITKDHTHVSFALWRHLQATADSFDIVHIHSWWNILVLGAAWICKKKNIKPVLSPHGMFSDYIMNTNNTTLKRLLHRLWGKKLLDNTELHVSTQMEWSESQKMIPNWKGMIIPNLVSLPSGEFKRKENDVFTIGFLSRIDPKKGLDILIHALSKVNFRYRLIVAGEGEKKYVHQLKALSKALGIQHCIEWVGWKNGVDKFDFLARLDLFALTSHSENFAIVVIESLSVGTPVLISYEVGLASYVQQYGLGWLTGLDIQNITSELQKANYNSNNRKNIELISPQLIKEHFNKLELAKQYVNLYVKSSYTN